MFNADLAGRLARHRYKELLRQAEQERRARMAVDGNGNWKSVRASSLELQENWKGPETAERLGREFGRMVYCYYSELLDRGLPQDRAVELTKDLIRQLTWNGCNGHRSRFNLG